jgi:hypothetical protein
MALTGKKYEKFYATTGSGDDKVKSDTLTQAEAFWDGDRASGCKDLLEDFTLGPIVFQLQQMQDEIDYLRTEISNNKDKATFPGLGTSGSTALAGDTTTISTAQANAITANTAKTGITTSQATAITDNSNNKMTVVPNSAFAGIQDLRCGVVYDAKAGTHTLNFVYSETTPKATTTKTGSIQLK